MAWVTAHWRVVRLAGLALVILALIGPWGYDRVVVPAEYECHDPFVRLGGDFCGLPLSGLWLIGGLGNEVNSQVQRVLMGEVEAMEVGPVLLCAGGVLATIAPIISLVWRLRSRHSRWTWLHMSLSIPAVALIGSLGLLQLTTATCRPAQIWGLWLYVGSVFLSLVEQSVVALGRKRHRSMV